MIDKETFRKIEGRLYRYYENLREIEKLEFRCSMLEEQKERLRKDLRETNIEIEEESRSITFGERVQSSFDGTSYAEREVIRQIERLEREWKDTRRLILKNHAKINEMKRQNTDLEFALRLLSDTCKRFVKLKYKDEKSLEQIGRELHMSKSTAHGWREDIAKAIANSLEFIK